ncbi:hypothetical protein lerEdw1_002091 [Lerista edwardsae]|nr:hypothetical protein lerEdw1_002091 [Lerista edwardsae]
MQPGDVREYFIATGIRVVADVLTNIFSSSWAMGDSSSPERTSGRRSHLSRPSMKSEERRLRTFQHWPDSAPVSPDDLAAAGFFFIGPDDRVECFCCGGVLYDWFAEDDPVAEHKKYFPTCPFIQGQHIGNQQMPHAGEIQDCVDGQFLGMLQSLGMEEAIVETQPEYPEMETEDGRLTTFVNWPAYAQVSPEALARAGFFYTGHDDYVQCFCCDGALRNWERGDDPWVEHARWFPRCHFLLESRGRDFINSIQDPYVDSSESNIYQPESPPVTPQEPTRQRPAPGRTRRELEQQNEPAPAPNMEEQLQRLKEERMCKVCMDRDVSILLVPCGHLVVCAECAPNLRHCPICRGTIRDSVKAYLS